MSRTVAAILLALGLLLPAVTQQSAGIPTTATSVPQTVSKPKLFPISSGSAFIDTEGRVVFTTLEPQLQADIEGASNEIGGIRQSLGSAPIHVRFEEFSEGVAVVGWALCPMCRNNFWVNGFVDETGRLVIPPKSAHTRYGSFREGLAQYVDRGFGFIDRTGSVAIPAKFYEVGNFSEGLAFVRPSDERRYGYINKQGRLVIKSQFKYATDFHEGMALVILTGDIYGFIDRTGKVVLQSGSWQGVDHFSEGLALVRVSVRNNRLYRGSEDLKYGFIDQTGRFVIPPKFDRVEGFSEGRAMFREFVKDRVDFRSRDSAYPATNRVGFIDSTGQVVIKAEYVNGKGFSEGLAAVAVMSPNKELAWGFIDRDGRVLIPPQFSSASSFRGGLAAVNCDPYGRNCKAYIDQTGRIVWQEQIK